MARDVFGDVNIGLPDLQQFQLFTSVFEAQKQSDRRFFSRHALVIIEPAQVKLHLAFKARLEAPIFKSSATRRRKPR